MVDFTDLDGSVNLPTPDECREGKPNALGWYQTIENGAMFSPRRRKETDFIREPASSAWIVTLCSDTAVVKQHAAEIERVVARFDYTRLYYCIFFWVESAWWRMVVAK
ncbi:MAG: hypothetical protein NTV49_10485, partial [Kiritimatiellaeota bacterium]|nr:hypothetical protein [Kiritimatiellota bacterium]